jgi:hypothetical protein
MIGIHRATVASDLRDPGAAKPRNDARALAATTVQWPCVLADAAEENGDAFSEEQAAA